MHLNNDGEVYKHCCDKWSNPKDELWIYHNDGKVGIYCIEHEHCLLGYENDLPEEKL